MSEESAAVLASNFEAAQEIYVEAFDSCDKSVIIEGIHLYYNPAEDYLGKILELRRLYAENKRFETDLKELERLDNSDEHLEDLETQLRKLMDALVDQEFEF